MSEQTEVLKKKHVRPEFLEWAWRLGALGLLVLNLYAKNNFVSIDDYKADKKGIDVVLAQLTKAIDTMQVENKVNDRQDEILRDHEQRIRSLENKRR